MSLSLFSRVLRRSRKHAIKSFNIHGVTCSLPLLWNDPTFETVFSLKEKRWRSSDTQTRPVSSIGSNASSSSARVAKTLYRQLLNWCNTTDLDVPLELPPIHIRAPEQVDARRLELAAANSTFIDNNLNNTFDNEDLIAAQRVYRLLPSRSEITRTSLTVQIQTVSDLRNFLRAIFRLNMDDSFDMSHDKKRISVAFEALKSLNELTEVIYSMQKRRQEHLNRDDKAAGVVAFRVGQVVQHQHERWRGVIAGWERVKINSSDSLVESKTSLTNKDYSGLVENDIRYEVLLDEGDAYLTGSSSGKSNATQLDLVALGVDKKDPSSSLTRIRNRYINGCFAGFDKETNCFMPNRKLIYEYPMDFDNGLQKQNILSESEKSLSSRVTSNIQMLASQIEKLILNNVDPQKHGNSMLTTFLTRFSDLAEGRNVIPLSVRFSPTPDTVSEVTRAMQYLRLLLNTSMEVFEIMLHRHQAKKSCQNLRFSLGDIVRHKVFGFRGVVVAWDPRPTVDVTAWDGLQHIENPMELPFYHVIPDRGDCITAFGAHRSFRYVCEENLEICAEHNKQLDVDLGPDWVRTYLPTSYRPSIELRFKHGYDLDDEGASEHCMTKIQHVLNTWQFGIQSGESEVKAEDPAITMSTLFQLLQLVDNADDAAVIHDFIKDVRKAHSKIELRRELENGTAELISGNGEEALTIYRKIIEQDSAALPSSSISCYTEAYNKIAICEYMLGRLDESLASTNKVLELDPLHLQALSSLGLIYFRKKDFTNAADVFQKCIKIDPWSPVAARLSQCLDLLNKVVHPDEISE